jgi:hypothetical protein
LGTVIFEIVENNFVEKYTDTYHLSILLGMDRFSFLVSDPQQNVLLLRSQIISSQVSSLDRIGNELKNLYINDEILKLSYRSVKIGLLNQKNTLVPSDLFVAENKEVYLKNIVPNLEKGSTYFDILKPLAMVNLYAINNQFVNQLYGYFPNAKIHHSVTSLIMGYRKIAENRTGHQIFLNVRRGLLQISLFDNKELLFCNSFAYESSQDFIYYVMLVFDQFQLKPEGNTVHISGQIIKDSEIYHLLFRYIRHIEMVPFPDYYKMGEKGKGVSDYQYFDLFSLKLCE